MEHPNQDSHPLSGTTVLVTGGTGFTGSNLVRKLISTNAEVRGIARESSEIADDMKDEVRWYRGDVYDAEVVQEAMDGVDYVFHMATSFRDPGASDEEYWKVHVESTQLLARAALQQSDFRRFIHTSTVGVHGHVSDPPADETAPYDPGDHYQETKLEGELWIRDFADREKLPLVVLRPAAIMGPTDRRLLKLFKFAKYGFFPLLDGHETRYHLIHVEDLTDCMLLSAHHPDAQGEVFICGNAEPTTVVEILTQIGEIMDRTVRFVHLPSRPLFMITDFVEWASKQLNVEPILYRRRLEFFTKDRAFDTSKLQDVLNFDFRYANREGIKDTAEGYIDSGWI